MSKFILPVLLLAWLSVVLWNSAKPLPPGTHVASQIIRLSEADVDFRHPVAPYHAPPTDDESAIERAEQLIVVDRSPVTAELALRLLGRRRLRPHLKIVLVTDPAGEALGGSSARTLSSLEEAGVIVARVRLDRLRDSNPLYTGLWRLVFGWWSEPFDEAGRITMPALARSYNFKSDQRQLLVADDGSGGWTAIVATGRPTTSLILRGSLARDMIADELQVAAWSTDDDRLPAAPVMGGSGVGSIDARFLTEGAIETSLLDAMGAAGGGDRIGIAVEDLSDRRLIAAALRAALRGASLQVLLAHNREPNQAVAAELLRESGGRIEIRWCSSAHAASQPKLLILRHGSDVWINFGTANFTRRNLGDLNLAASVELRMPLRVAAARALTDYFAELWSGAAADPEFAAATAAHYWHYRFAEASGLSGF
jgi:hypothetical protein